jgi:hypothetical protein
LESVCLAVCVGTQGKLILWLDEGDNNILFDRVDPNDYVSYVGSEGERAPRDEIDGELVE